MNYLLMLGREAALSFEEFDSVCASANTAYSVEWIEGSIAHVSLEVDDSFFKNNECAGLVKVARIIAEGDEEEVEQTLYDDVVSHRVHNGKATIGVSVYTPDESAFGQTLARHIKKTLKEDDISLRYLADDAPLSSGSIKKNAILEEGAEYCLVKHNDTWFAALTCMIQDSDAWSMRDFDKPSRDMRRGMLPPKLARIMTHLTKLPKGATILDPFCGTGTLAMEALLAGYTVIAADADPNAVASTKENIGWFNNHYSPNTTCTILQADARAISKRIKKLHVDAIATEPFLGNEKPLPHAQRQQEALRLLELYKTSLLDWKKFLQKDSMVVLILPQFITREGRIEIPIHNQFRALGYELQEPVAKTYPLNDEYSPHGNLLYTREGQRVEREVLLLSKI